MRFINLTPHDVVLYSMASVSRGRLHPGQKPVMTIPASGAVARAEQFDKLITITASGVPIVEAKFGVVKNLPDPEPGTYFILSAIAAERAKPLGRSDLLVPAGCVRDASGCTIGATKLALVR